MSSLCQCRCGGESQWRSCTKALQSSTWVHCRKDRFLITSWIPWEQKTAWGCVGWFSQYRNKTGLLSQARVAYIYLKPLWGVIAYSSLSWELLQLDWDGPGPRGRREVCADEVQAYGQIRPAACVTGSLRSFIQLLSCELLSPLKWNPPTSKITGRNSFLSTPPLFKRI